MNRSRHGGLARWWSPVGRAFLIASLGMGTNVSAQKVSPPDPGADTPVVAPGGDSPQDSALPDRSAGAEEAATAGDILSAVVDSTGRLIRGNGAVRASRLTSAAGRYEVIFDRDVSNGVFSATIGSSGDQIEPFGQVSVARRFGNTSGVFVQTADPRGTASNRGFHLTVVPASGSNPGGNNIIQTVSVTVHRHGSVALTDAEADRILQDMGTVLQNSDRTGDVATRVRFVRNGPVRVLPPNVDAVIQTQAQLSALFAAGNGVKIVRDIRFCGGPGGSIIGCAPVGNPAVNISAVRFTPALEGILWVHEYGHNAGLGHREDDVDAVMFPSIGGSHRVVNQSESIAFRGGPAAATGRVMAASHAHGAQVRPARGDVRDFVRQHYVEGVPFDAARRFTEADAEVLLEMLAEPEQNEEFLPEIVTTLCYIGSAKAVQPLIAFVRGPLSSPMAFKAKNAALIHLGDLVNAADDPAAGRAVLGFLTNVASVPVQAQALAAPRVAAAAAEVATLDNVTPPTPDELAAELAVSATWGLALSGSRDAEAAIGRLKEDGNVYQAVSQLADDAARMAQGVRAMGQAEFKRMQSEHQHPE